MNIAELQCGFSSCHMLSTTLIASEHLKILQARLAKERDLVGLGCPSDNLSSLPGSQEAGALQKSRICHSEYFEEVSYEFGAPQPFHIHHS
jgi:hypothetical protein